MTLQNYAKFNLKIIPNYFIFVYFCRSKNEAFIVTTNRPFHENTLQEIDRTMTINAIAPMYVGLAALQDMVARDHHFIRCMEGIFPERLFDWFFGDVFGLYTVMDHFKGRK